MTAGRTPGAGKRSSPPQRLPFARTAAVAAHARARIAAGLKRAQVAVELGVSSDTLNALLRAFPDPDAPPQRAPAPPKPPAFPLPVKAEDAVHLVHFTLPPLPEPEPKVGPGWAERLEEVAWLRGLAAKYSGEVKAGLLHLSDLNEHHPRHYPEVAIPATDHPTFVSMASIHAGLAGSPAAMCVEAG